MRYLAILLLSAAPISAQVTCGDKTASEWLAELEGLPEQSEDAQQALRREIPRALQLLGHASAPRLIELLESEHPAVRLTAVQSLGEVGASSAVKPLLALLEDEADGGVREAVIEALARIDARPELVVPALVKRVRALELQGDSAHERAGSIGALARLGWRSPAAREVVLRALRDEAGPVRRRAQAGLARDTGPCAIPGLVDSLADDDTRIRFAAAEVLDDMALRYALPVRKAIVLMQEHPQLEVRQRAAAALGVLASRGPQHTEWAVPRLYSLLSDRDLEVRCAALTSLVESTNVPSEDALEALELASESEAPELRECALALRAKLLEGQGARAALQGAELQRALQQLREGDAAERQQALRELMLGPASPEVVIAVRDQLSHADPSVRVAAAEVLGALGARKALPNLLRAAGEGQDPVPRAAALYALRELYDPAAVPVVAAALRHPDPVIAGAATVPAHGWAHRAQGTDLVPALIDLLERPMLRQVAADALGAIGAEAACERLAAIAAEADQLGDGSAAGVHRVDRRFALRALGRIGPAAKAAIPTLEALLGSQVREVRVEARAALIRIRADAELQAQIAAACKQAREALGKPR